MTTTVKFLNSESKNIFENLNKTIRSYWFSQYHHIFFIFNPEKNCYAINAINFKDNSNTIPLYDHSSKSFFNDKTGSWVSEAQITKYINLRHY